jgi:hypothetical protein
MTEQAMRLYVTAGQKQHGTALQDCVTFYLRDRDSLLFASEQEIEQQLALLKASAVTVSLALCTVPGRLVVARDGVVHIRLTQVVQELSGYPCRRVGGLLRFELDSEGLRHLLWKALRISLVRCRQLPVQLRSELCEQLLSATVVKIDAFHGVRLSLVCMVSSRFLRCYNETLVRHCGFNEPIDLEREVQFLQERLQKNPSLGFEEVAPQLVASFESRYPERSYQSQIVASYLWDSAHHRVEEPDALEV